MIRSMTGFGRVKAAFRSGAITIEMKTVNHKFFEMTAKLPSPLSTFEDKIKDIVQRKIRRGKVNLNLIYDGVIAQDEKVGVNESLARRYFLALLKLQKSLGIKGELTVEDLMLFPGVVTHEVREGSLARLWPFIRSVVERTADRVVADRAREGRALYKDLAGRAGRIGKMLAVIGKRAEVDIEEYRKKFARRVKEFSGGQEIDSGRLAMEVAIYAKNCDITEEITRLGNHLTHFIATIARDEEAGKKLDFIAQELHREINTIGAKAGDFKISKNVIEIKSEIEKIREQVKNIE